MLLIEMVAMKTAGIAFLSDEVSAGSTADLAFQFETWDAGNGYVGAEVAGNPDFVRRIEAVLRNEWPHPSRTNIDSF